MLKDENDVAGSAGLRPEIDQCRPDRYDHHGSLLVQGLPLPHLARNAQSQAAYCAVTPVDASGRLADRAPLQALGWLAGRTLDIAYQDGAIAVTARRGGRWKITRQGYLLLPSSLRRSCGMAAGDRLLVVAYPDRGSLVAYTMGALELMVALYAAAPETR